VTNIDHLIFTTATLEEGMDHIEAQLGMRPVIGGRHEQWGTHNALLSLGSSYLEVVAPCPDLPIPERGLWLAEYFQKAPQLTTWALQTKNIQASYQRAIAEDIVLGEIKKGQRHKPDGSLLSWQLTDPYPLPFGGTLPFLIDWGNSEHPSQETPKAGVLKELIIQHPDPDLISNKLDALAIQLPIERSTSPGLKAMIDTKAGLIELV